MSSGAAHANVGDGFVKNSSRAIAPSLSRLVMPHERAAPASPSLTASTILVTSCADNGSSGTLRSIITAASEGDTVDLSALNCPSSTITLMQGQIVIPQALLTVRGPTPTPAGPVLTIDAGGVSRIIYGSSNAGTLTVESLRLAHGTSAVPGGQDSGGCVFVRHSLVLSNSVVDTCTLDGRLLFGGAIASSDALTLSNSKVTGATATAAADPGSASSIQVSGAALYAYSALHIENSTVSNNKGQFGYFQNGANTYGLGGAFEVSPFYASSMTTIDFSTISDNFSIGFGGAFASFSHEGSAVITITNSTISNNTAHYYGGAIEAENGSYLTLINTTVSGNSASVAGGINVYRANSFTAKNSTIAFNHADNTGGLFLGAPTTIDSTIIAKNSAVDPRHAADVASYNVVMVAGSNNLVTSNDAKVTFESTTLRSDPLLQPLADNGGPTLTHALDTGSPAIDAGDNSSGLKWDQRGYGFPRAVGKRLDIGAFELLDDRIFFDGFESL